MEPIKPQELTIKAFGVSPEQRLFDTRIPTRGLYFGTIEGVARQYGIKMTKEGNCLKFTAPKSRLQLFIEKLYFSRVNFVEVKT